MNRYMNTADFDFHLPEELIAQTPLEKRDASKLLIVNRETGEMQDKHFHSIIDMLEPGDALSLWTTPAFSLPASMVKRKKLEVMWNFSCSKNTAGDEWEVLAKPAKRLKVGTRVSLVMAVSALLLRKNWLTGAVLSALNTKEFS